MISISLKKTMLTENGRTTLDVDISIDEGSIVAITGPSGVGKTTFLRMIAGLTVPDNGRISFGDRVWYDRAAKIYLPARKRETGFVFQEHALFPNMTLRENILYACGDRSTADRLVGAAQLTSVADRYPSQLSAGQKQRCALLRSIARNPRVLLLDEPFSSLDTDMKKILHDELLGWRELYGFTVIMVSHDRAEVVRLSERVIALRSGVVESDLCHKHGCASNRRDRRGERLRMNEREYLIVEETW